MCKVGRAPETIVGVTHELLHLGEPAAPLAARDPRATEDASAMASSSDIQGESVDARFHRMIAAHGPAIGRIARSYAKSVAEREDLQQDIAMGLFRALPTFRGECSERTFVLRLAHNQALSTLTRRRARREDGEVPAELADLAPDPEVLAGLSQRMRAVFGAIHTLPWGQRQVLTLALEGLSHDEIGEVVGISAGNVAVRVSRARAELKKRLGGHHE